ncbi:MAG: hypothetical protein Q9207_004278 [Kuettlingeria erythrocarpa]
MVENSVVQGSTDQSHAANASRSLRGVGSQTPYTLNDNISRHGRNAAASGGPGGSDSSTIDVISTHDISEEAASTSPAAALPSEKSVQGETPSAIEAAKKPSIFTRFYRDCKAILLASWINTLLVFVPVGIAVEIAGVSPTLVFALNAVAIVPLAGLLSYATQSVASELGDTIGALMNVTFGNAVELIIFMYVQYRIGDNREPEACRTGASNSIAIALVKNEIRIVQASLLGSILANLLLILGMCFLYGGLRFREQIYNSTVTQMSACLLSLSVMSLLLPTAFHASFTDNGQADEAVLQVSRGTSVILLLVYVLYLLFQLKSHAYLYQSTPQHVIDEESHPGLLADMLHSSTSSSSSSSSSSSDSDGSSKSHTTAKRIKRVLRRRRRRKSSASSKETASAPSFLRTPSGSTLSPGVENGEFLVVQTQDASSESSPQHLRSAVSGDEADIDGESHQTPLRHSDKTIKSRDFEKGSQVSNPKRSKSSYSKKAKEIMIAGQQPGRDPEKQAEISPPEPLSRSIYGSPGLARQGLPTIGVTVEESPRRAFGKRGIANVLPAMVMPAMPKMLSTTVFSAANSTGPSAGGLSTGVATTAPLHRSTSLPSRLNRIDGPGATVREPHTVPYVRPVTALHPTFDAEDNHEAKKHLSRTSAIILLVVSTGLVALCADFVVESINYIVDNTSVSEAFIGLIILPIVGNAAEHVTAVVVAGKNKMDLAIGVAVGSSIQIALFVTPVIVLLGWALQKDMSLYFSLFETISLFVSAFIINFLILDGKTNYLEGALLIAAYVIIALAAFFYPDSSQQSPIGGADDAAKRLVRMF